MVAASSSSVRSNSGRSNSLQLTAGQLQLTVDRVANVDAASVGRRQVLLEEAHVTAKLGIRLLPRAILGMAELLPRLRTVLQEELAEMAIQNFVEVLAALIFAAPGSDDPEPAVRLALRTAVSNVPPPRSYTATRCPAVIVASPVPM